MMPLVLFGNYGNPSLALLQWCVENFSSLQREFSAQISVVSIDTGWHSEDWLVHVSRAEDFARGHGFSVVRLKAQPDFAEAVRQRGYFPSVKYQWCASMLKGLPFLDWLDAVDPEGHMTIMLATRRSAAAALANLVEHISASEHYGGRAVWHPLCHLDEEAEYHLIQRAGFTPFPHRSLECEPCIHAAADFQRASGQNAARLAALEQELNQTFFGIPIATHIERLKNSESAHPSLQEKSSFFAGCGSPFACGE